MPKILPENLKDVLLDAMNVSETSIEATEYLKIRFRKLLTETKSLDKLSDIMQKVEDFAKYTAFKLRSSSEPWLGQINDSSDYKNMQAEMALDAVKHLEDNKIGTEKSAAFEFAVNDNSELLRGYASDGQSLDTKSLTSMDTLFNAYLAQNNLVSKGSTLYEANEKGQIKLDANGAPVKADPQAVRDLINDVDKGYANYLNPKGIQITCQEQQYPSAQKEAQVKTAVKQAIDAGIEAVEATEEAPTVETHSSMKT